MQTNWEKHWYEIYGAFEKPFSKRTKRQKVITMNKDQTERGGLCWALANGFDMYSYHWLDSLADSMDIGTAWWAPSNNKGDQARSDFALLMWALGNEGFKDLLRYAEDPEKYTTDHMQ